MKTIHSIFKDIKNKKFNHTRFNHVFVEDTRTYKDYTSIEKDDLRKKNKETMDALAHFEDYKNWYLPFDSCSLLTIGDDTWMSVTLGDNPDRLLESKRKFCIAVSDNGNHPAETEGFFKIVGIDEHVESMKNYSCASIAIDPEYVFNGDENSPCKYKIVVYFGEITGKNKKMRFIDTMNQYSNFDYNEAMRELGTKLSSTVAYFTRLMINTKLFVVEESVTEKKKGKVRSKPGTSLFKVIDLRTIQKKYIKLDKNITDEERKKSGGWRRRHERTYRDDRYVNMKGQTQIIEAIWIGPTESFDPDNDRLYKVRLDIG